MNEDKLQELRTFVFNETVDLINPNRPTETDTVCGLDVEFDAYWESDDVPTVDIINVKISPKSTKKERDIWSIFYLGGIREDGTVFELINAHSKKYKKIQDRIHKVCHISNEILEPHGISWMDILDEAEKANKNYSKYAV